MHCDLTLGALGITAPRLAPTRGWILHGTTYSTTSTPPRPEPRHFRYRSRRRPFRHPSTLDIRPRPQFPSSSLFSPSLAPRSHTFAGRSDRPRACTRCKRLKVRCENVNGTRPCKRCRNANAECVTAQRKQRP
ncbi:hypothetical protein EXIGLDRAFT_723225, partial [Exidia glandulosa HHB12029]